MNIWSSLILGAALISACIASEYLIMTRLASATVDSGLYRVPVDGSGQQRILNFTFGATAALYDSKADALFYVVSDLVDVSVGVQRFIPNIRRCGIDGGNDQLLLAGAGGALAVDPQNEKLYFTSDFSDNNSGDLRLNVMGYDGSDAVTIFPDPSQPAGIRITSIAVDVSNQKVYLSSEDGITTINVDGTGEEALLDATDAIPKSLVLDELSGKLYFCNEPKYQDSSANLGLNVLTIKTKTRTHLPLTYDTIKAITVMKNRVYVVSGPSAADFAIRRTKLAGGDETVLPTGDGGVIVHITAPVLHADGDAGAAMTSSLATTLSALLLGLLTIFFSVI